MKFSCEQCNAHYQIQEEKLGPRGVRVRCKRCGFVITVRPKGNTHVPEPAALPSEKDIEDSFDELERTAVQPASEFPQEHQGTEVARAPAEPSGRDPTTISPYDPAALDRSAVSFPNCANFVQWGRSAHLRAAA